MLVDNLFQKLRLSSDPYDEVTHCIPAIAASGVSLHPGALDTDDDAAMAEVLDADPFGAREELVDIEGDTDEERVARTVHPLEREFRIRCRLSRC